MMLAKIPPNISIAIALHNKFIGFPGSLDTLQGLHVEVKSNYYTPGPERAKRVHELFERIAGRYDLINDVQSAGLHRLWKRTLVAEAGCTGGERALDLCCGTADIADRLQAQGANVTGCDFSRAMLARAAHRNTRLLLVQADALKLPFRDEEFQLVTVGYGLRNLADLRGGMSEVLRVLKPGGRFLVLDFAKPTNKVWRALYFSYLRLAVPLFGRLFAGNASAYAYILDSLERYPAQGEISELLRHDGFGKVRLREFLGGIMSLHVAYKG